MTLVIGLICISVFFLSTIILLMRRQSSLRQVQEGLVQDLLEARDQQKEVIFRNMHDHVNPMLRFVMRNIEAHRIELVKNNLRPEAFEQDIDVLLMALNDIRSCTHEEVPLRLKEVGLLKALEEMLGRLTIAAGITPGFSTMTSRAGDFDLLRQLEIYRICSELIENIIKHASCSSLTINVTERNEALVINFIHDGHGISNEEAAELISSSAGTGLRSCEARARLLHAEIDYMSSPTYYSTELLVHYQWKNKLR